MGKETSKSEETEDKAKHGKAHEKANSKAKMYAENTDKLNELIDKASKKASTKRGPLDTVWAQLMACIRLLRAYANGSYRQIPWQSLLMIIASIVYFVMPIDAIPDFLTAIGYLDDVALLRWTIQAVGSDIDAFTEWEQGKRAWTVTPAETTTLFRRAIRYVSSRANVATSR